MLEIRATESGILDGIRLPQELTPSADDPRRTGVFSIDSGGGEGRTRKLPLLYMGNSPLFGHRDMDVVARRLESTVAAVLNGYEVPTYSAHPVSFEGRKGLYTRDFYSRSPYRRRLMRLGMIFADDPFPRFVNGALESDDFGSFRPEFVVLEGVDEPLEGLVRVTMGRLVYECASLRLGRVGPAELKELMDLFSGTIGLGAADPAVVVDALTAQ